MADFHISDIPGVCPSNRRSKRRKKEDDLRALAQPAEGNAFLYVMEWQGAGIVKVGVSMHPYWRHAKLEREHSPLLISCLIEVDRTVAFQVEAALKAYAKTKGLVEHGEWLRATPKAASTAMLKRIARLRATVHRQIGDPSIPDETIGREDRHADQHPRGRRIKWGQASMPVGRVQGMKVNRKAT